MASHPSRSDVIDQYIALKSAVRDFEIRLAEITNELHNAKPCGSHESRSMLPGEQRSLAQEISFAWQPVRAAIEVFHD